MVGLKGSHPERTSSGIIWCVYSRSTGKNETYGGCGNKLDAPNDDIIRWDGGLRGPDGYWMSANFSDKRTETTVWTPKQM